jgi:hypothetical protein
MEYLNLLARSRGWSREILSRAVRDALDLSGDVEERFEEDAGTMRFQNIRDAELETVRRRVAAALANP